MFKGKVRGNWPQTRGVDIIFDQVYNGNMLGLLAQNVFGHNAGSSHLTWEMIFFPNSINIVVRGYNSVYKNIHMVK